MKHRNASKLKTMKKTILLLLCGTFAISAWAQENTTQERVRKVADTDTVNVPSEKGSTKMKITFEMGDDGDEIITDRSIKRQEERHGDRTDRPGSRSKLMAGLSFSPFDLGLAKMIDNGKGTLSPENEFLTYRAWKSVNVGFDVAKVAYRFNDQFRVVLSAGFDWTHFRLKKDVIIAEDSRPLTYEDSDIDYTKNRFSSSYLRIPLTFEVRSKAGTFNERVRFSVGPIAGILIQGSQKFKSKEQGKKKNVDDFNYAPFRYGAFARVSYGTFGVYAKYYMNDMFQHSPDQKGLKNISFGLMLHL